MSAPDVFINDFAIRCALGANRDEVAGALASSSVRPAADPVVLADGRTTVVARYPEAGLGERRATRLHALVVSLLDAIEPGVAKVRESKGRGRIGVVIGSSNSGIDEALGHFRARIATGEWPPEFRYERQEMGDPALFAAEHAGVTGPVYTVSTACTSGAKAIIAGARMLQTGLVDAVICGGVDTLCNLTLGGFASLESLAPGTCNPFSLNRCGITIGEGGALFLLSREPGPWRLEGWGESSDAYHASAPDPTGAGGELAVRAALASAGAEPAGIGFVHAHGTATRLNDQMEAGLIHRVFGELTPVASTKPLTGHTLGAAGAVQAALCVLAMENRVYPPHIWDGVRDPDLPAIRLTKPGEQFDGRVMRMLSLSFAFGGSNAAIVLGRS